nr:MAG TPA_asm: hypothetical protein [Bacteriophage sp.]
MNGINTDKDLLLNYPGAVIPAAPSIMKERRT